MKLMPLLLLFLSLVAWADEVPIKLDKAPINLNDKASLQRGAGLYMNYCLGCHSLQFMRYNRMAQAIGIVSASGHLDEKLLKDNLIFSAVPIRDPIRSAMPSDKAKAWFGVAPPDLTLIARVRGANWLYTYLRSFYKDPNRPWGTNNLVFPGVAMPNVLLSLQGEQVPNYVNSPHGAGRIVENLTIINNGTMSPLQFNRAVADIVNFLSYVAEPERKERQFIGLWVIIYLLILLIFMYSLKELYWKKIKK